VKPGYVAGIFQVHRRITLLVLGNRKERAECPRGRALQQCPGKGVGQMLSMREGRSERV